MWRVCSVNFSVVTDGTGLGGYGVVLCFLRTSYLNIDVGSPISREVSIVIILQPL